MKDKSVPHGTKMNVCSQSEDNTIIIPELEEAKTAGPPRGSGIPCWTEEEEMILDRYYGYVTRDLIEKYLPNHNHASIQGKAARMGITGRGPRKK